MSFINNKLDFININGKGRGVIANDNIKNGEILIVDNPITFNDKKIYSDVFQLLHYIFQNQIIMKQFLKLCPTVLPENIDTISIQKELDKLKKLNKKLYNFFVNNYSIDDIYLYVTKYIRNAFQYGDKPCLLFIGTQLNHSCEPNTYFKKKNNHIIFTANKNINKGEEITDNYIDINLSKQARRQSLLYRYGFECNCTRCVD